MWFEAEHLTAEWHQDFCLVRLDAADQSANTLHPAMIENLNRCLDAIESHSPTSQGIVFTSAKDNSFINGADLFAMRSMTAESIENYLKEGQALMHRIAALPMPTVAVIGGHCLGGGLELALACQHRVVADHGAINLGLPEVRLGIVPAWGGTTRLVRQVGLMPALDLMLNGKMLPPRKAHRIGLIDAVVRTEALIESAKRLARQPIKQKLGWMHRLVAHVPLAGRLACHMARRQTRKITRGHYPAAEKLIDVVQAGWTHGPKAGFEAERSAALTLGQGNVAQNLMRLFFLRHDAKQAIENLGPIDRPIRQAAVIGGGTMGAGIAAAMVQSGIDVHLIDIDARAAGAGLQRVNKLIQKAYKAKRLSRTEVETARRRLWPASDWAGLEMVDLVIEAASEKLAVKRELFQKLESVVPDHAVLATNTSSLSMAQIAQDMKSPHRLIGLHFFNPVHKMPLVEVIRTDASQDQDLATAAQLALRLGKTPIVVSDAPGFAVNRILFPYLIEATRVAGEGAGIEQIDRAAKTFGMPMGPFELMDEVGLDVAGHILESVRQNLPHLSVPESFEGLATLDATGRKGGLGFYRYRKGRRIGVHTALCQKLFGDTSPKKLEQLEHRLVLPMVNEAVRLLEEGVIDSVDHIDLATVLGLGFAPFRGGLIQYARSLGPEGLLGAMLKLAQTHGTHLSPHPALRKAVETGEDYFERPTPPTHRTPTGSASSLEGGEP